METRRAQALSQLLPDPPATAPGRNSTSPMRGRNCYAWSQLLPDPTATTPDLSAIRQNGASVSVPCSCSSCSIQARRVAAATRPDSHRAGAQPPAGTRADRRSCYQTRPARAGNGPSQPLPDPTATAPSRYSRPLRSYEGESSQPLPDPTATAPDHARGVGWPGGGRRHAIGRSHYQTRQPLRRRGEAIE
jgi:hypothetical protein